MLQQIRDRVEECYQKAEAFYGIKIPRAKISFNLRGTTAGQFFGWPRNELKFNKGLLVDNFDFFMRDTVPHEVAHAVQRWQDKTRGYCSKPHGREWKDIMIRVYGLPPRVTHRMDTSKTAMRRNAFSYFCVDCSKTFELGSVRHKRIVQTPGRYRCQCGGKLSRKVTGNSKIKPIEIE